MSTTDKETKIFISRLEIKEVDENARTFEGLAATWDLDLGGDIIKKGAFRDTIKEWKQSGRILHLLDSHNWFSVRDAIGKLLDIKEVEDGLWTKWRIVPGADGDEILARLRPNGDEGAFVDSMSIGYRAKRWEIQEPMEEDERRVRILKEIELHEVSLVLFPMNPAARIDSNTVKEFASTVKSFANKVPLELRGELQEAVRDAVKPCPNDSTGDKGGKEGRKADPATNKNGRDAVAEEEDEVPDLSRLGLLKLRRLDTLRSHIGQGG